MAGETDLKKLLSGMKPRLQHYVFVFASLPPDSALPVGINPVMIFREKEEMTLIVEEGEAMSAGLQAGFRSRMITLEIHSSLEAIGFLAAITNRLAAGGMSVNPPVSAFHHDHLFVPADRAEEALRSLEDLAAGR